MFVARLGEWQSDAGLTQRQFAELLGVHEAVLSKLRTPGEGRRRPSPEFMALAISRAPEPWRSSLRTAREADEDAAVAVA